MHAQAYTDLLYLLGRNCMAVRLLKRDGQGRNSLPYEMAARLMGVMEADQGLARGAAVRYFTFSE